MKKIIFSFLLFLLGSHIWGIPQGTIFDPSGKPIATVDEDGYIVKTADAWTKVGRVTKDGWIYDPSGKSIVTVDEDGYIVKTSDAWTKVGRVSPRNMLVVAFLYFFTDVF